MLVCLFVVILELQTKGGNGIPDLESASDDDGDIEAVFCHACLKTDSGVTKKYYEKMFHEGCWDACVRARRRKMRQAEPEQAAAAIKEDVGQMCGQPEVWRGKVQPMISGNKAERRSCREAAYSMATNVESTLKVNRKYT